MYYRLDAADFLEMMNYRGLLVDDLTENNPMRGCFAEGNVSINEEILKEGLSVVKASYYTSKDLLLDCADEIPFLELHFNLSKSAIRYKTPFNVSEEVPSMTGNMIYVSPNERKSEISFHKENEYQTFDIHFPLTMLTSYWGESKLLDSFLDQVLQNRSAGLTDNKIKLSAKTLCAIQDIQHCTYEGLTRKVYLESKICEIMAYCFEEKPNNSPIKLSTRDIDCINYAAQIIKNNISTPITIEELARRVGINQTKLKIGFKNLFGTTVFGYLQELRMSIAKQFLFDSDLSIEQIGQKCGYVNISNFSNAFKNHFGISPSTLRNNQLSNYRSVISRDI